MKIIDGKGVVLGRLASFVAKEALRGEKIVVMNCEEVIITGSDRNLKKSFEEKRSRIGSGQKGPKIHRSSEKIVKRAIRGMLPNHRTGKGAIALKRVVCYDQTPPKLEREKTERIEMNKKRKFMLIKKFKK